MITPQPVEETGTQEDLKALGRVIRAYLGEKPQAWLAEQAGVGQSTISRIIAGRQRPTLETVLGISQALGVPEAELKRLAGYKDPRVPDPMDPGLLMAARQLSQGMAPFPDEARAKVRQALASLADASVTVALAFGDAQTENAKLRADLQALQAAAPMAQGGGVVTLYLPSDLAETLLELIALMKAEKVRGANMAAPKPESETKKGQSLLDRFGKSLRDMPLEVLEELERRVKGQRPGGPHHFSIDEAAGLSLET